MWSTHSRIRSHAAKAYASVQETYNDRLQESLRNAIQPHKWWSTLKRSLFGVYSALPLLRKINGDLEFDPGGKSEILSSTFINKQIDWSPNLPSTCHPQPAVTGVAFRSADILRQLINLDSHGGIGPNGIFPLFFKKLAKLLAPKFSKLFRILYSQLVAFPWSGARLPSHPFLRVILVHNSLQIIALFPLLLSYPRYLKSCFLQKLY